MIGQRAVLVGATGLIGHHCLELLLEDKEDKAFVSVSVLTRRPLNRTHAKLHEIVIDFERLPEQEITQVDTAFCCLGSTLAAAGSQAAFERIDYDYVRQFAELAERGGARQFVLVSTLGASARSPMFYSRVKGRAEQAITARAFQSVHILRPSMLLGARTKRRLNEELVKPLAHLVSPLLMGPLRRLRPVSAEQVAKLMLVLAKREQPGVHIHYPSAP